MLRRASLEEALSARIKTRPNERPDPLLRQVREEMERERARTAADKWDRTKADIPHVARLKKPRLWLNAGPIRSTTSQFHDTIMPQVKNFSPRSGNDTCRQPLQPYGSQNLQSGGESMAERKSALNRAPQRPELERLLAQAKTVHVTEAILREQRASFVYGNAPKGSRITKASAMSAIDRVRVTNAEAE